MSELKHIDSEELQGRLGQIVKSLDLLCVEIAPKLKELANLRLEAENISKELSAREKTR